MLSVQYYANFYGSILPPSLYLLTQPQKHGSTWEMFPYFWMAKGCLGRKKNKNLTFNIKHPLFREIQELWWRLGSWTYFYKATVTHYCCSRKCPYKVSLCRDFSFPSLPYSEIKLVGVLGLFMQLEEDAGGLAHRTQHPRPSKDRHVCNIWRSSEQVASSLMSVRVLEFQHMHET